MTNKITIYTYNRDIQHTHLIPGVKYLFFPTPAKFEDFTGTDGYYHEYNKFYDYRVDLIYTLYSFMLWKHSDKKVCVYHIEGLSDGCKLLSVV